MSDDTIIDNTIYLVPVAWENCIFEHISITMLSRLDLDIY